MPTTYKAISVVSTTATSVLFENIPQTYDDLVIHAFARAGASSSIEHLLQLYFNDDQNANYSNQGLTTATGFSGTGAASGQVRWLPGAPVTAGSFAHHTIYIPRYRETSCGTKVALVRGANPNDYQQSSALSSMKWNSSAAITKIDVRVQGYNFVSGSSIGLYGIKNS